jgi:monoamine oxidase
MERREFLKQGSLVSLGGMFLPSLLFGSCRKLQLIDEINFEGKVIIIGAGVSGLYAGYLLHSKGIEFEILEASDKIGGRMGRLTGFADFPLDTGAQWLHGQNNIVGDLIKSTNTKITLDDTELAFWFNNQLVTQLPKDIDIFENNNLPDISFKDYATQEGFDSNYDYIIENLAGDQGASASTLSTYWNNKEEENWVSGDEDFKFEDTFFDLFDTHIAVPISSSIQLNTPVKKIDYKNDKIEITDSNNQSYQADKVILTVPITVLKENKIEFIPTLSTEKTTAFSKIGMGPGMKVFLKFSETFYHDNIIGGPICAAYANEKIGKAGNDHVLLAFIMGDQAQFLTDLGSDEAITTALVNELETMYPGKAMSTFLSSSVHNFTTHPYIGGAYSYSTIGMGNSREISAQAVENKIFFAGEAMNLNGHHQTVFGAVETAYREVNQILKN